MNSRVFGLLINTITHPSHISVLFRNMFKKPYKAYSDEKHLDAAMKWLVKSQDKSGCGGCAEAYTFDGGWHPPYPETTGYIIETFLEYSKLKDDSSYVERAKRMGDWEIDIQFPSGAVRGGVGINDYPIVFNTGQVIFGWVQLYNHTKIKKYLDAAEKAADWLVEIMDEDGKWTNSTYRNAPHAYNSRVAWSILEVYKTTGNEKYRKAGEKNIDWVMSLYHENGFFDLMEFNPNDVPLTHTIAYTLRGLLESALILGGEKKDSVIKAVANAATNIINTHGINMDNIHSSKYLLPGRLGANWKTEYKFSCLTGNAQFAIIFQKLFEISNEDIYSNAADALLEYNKMTQNLKSKNSGINGGIAGSYPIWGDYVKLSYPNWAAKFFAEALIWKLNR